MKNRKAIVTYVDNNSYHYSTEFHWLYKSWRVSELESEWDIVVYCPPNFLGKNTILTIKNISNESFTIVNCTKQSGIVNYIASETIQQLNNIDTDLDTFSDLFELIEGTNPFVKYI